MRALAFALLLLTACSATLGERWRAAHPDFQRSLPIPGQPLAEAIASLEDPDAPDPPIVSGTRLLAVDVDPWEPVDADLWLDLDPPEDALHALIALRSCQYWDGFQSALRERASWLLFRGGRVIAFDYWEIGVGCSVENHFLPTAPEQRRLERDLSRDVGRRYPVNALGADDAFRKGLVYVEHGRIEEADAMLGLGKRALAEDIRAANEEARDAPSETQLAESRALRAELADAIRDARGIRLDPEERFWKGKD